MPQSEYAVRVDAAANANLAVLWNYLMRINYRTDQRICESNVTNSD